MDGKTKYFLETFAYGICFILGVVSLIYFSIQKSLFLSLLSLIFAYVSIDNFFCGSHAKKCGFPIRSHYILPWKIKSI